MMSITKHFNRRLFLSVLLIVVSQFNYGFDNQAFAQTQAMDAFARQFGTYNPNTQTYVLEPYWLSLFNSTPYVGFAIGLIIIGSMISARWGRRMAMFCMSIYALGSATVVVTSQTRGQIMAARILNYVYVGMELATVPVFQAEIVPAPVRGLAVSTYQLSLGCGGLVINGIARATSNFPDRRAYAIPFGLFLRRAHHSHLLHLSPRWLMTRNRLDEARSAHKKYREGTMPDDAVELEFTQLHAALLNKPEQGHAAELLKGTNLKRTAIVVGMNFFQQATGQAFASQYGTLFVKSLETVNPFSISLSTSVIGCRLILLISAFIQASALFIMGALGLRATLLSQGGAKSGGGGEVAMLVIFTAGFLWGWGPLTYVMAHRGLASIVNIVMNFLGPGGGGGGGRVGFIFGSIAVTSHGVLRTYVVAECKGRGLEEIDRIFLEHVPVKNFARHPRGAD
ncbi:sugar transporter [Diplogelasinospora grovesii]|uniref:Sugar transporter n=1 Tax=Diplogelasinospora grovesii TaxID=303347 RepID=A0AAN6N777_9PEZI|nr:sugar transporter [Diplogelasinospora grovesii]